MIGDHSGKILFSLCCCFGWEYCGVVISTCCTLK
jgi:hypothetical protein